MDGPAEHRRPEVLGEAMGLTPEDLCNKEFKRAMMRGYDPDDVDGYIEQVAGVLERLMLQLSVLREQHAQQQQRLKQYAEMETSLHNALSSSQKFAQDILDSAKRQADALVEEAKLEREKARQMPDHVRRQVAALQEQKQRLHDEIEAILEAHGILLRRLREQREPTVSLSLEPEDAPAPELDEHIEQPPSESEDSDE